MCTRQHIHVDAMLIYIYMYILFFLLFLFFVFRARDRETNIFLGNHYRVGFFFHSKNKVKVKSATLCFFGKLLLFALITMPIEHRENRKTFVSIRSYVLNKPFKLNQNKSCTRNNITRMIRNYILQNSLTQRYTIDYARF